MKEISLTRGKVAIVDDEWFEYLSQWKWQCNNTGYASRSERIGINQRKTVLMHRIVANAPADQNVDVDHINHNRLDNRSSNLRFCDSLGTARNVSVRKEKRTSSYKGMHQQKGKWVASISTSDARYTIHGILSEQRAAELYDAMSRYYFGDFASPNFEGTLSMSYEDAWRIVRLENKKQMSSQYIGVSYDKSGWRKRWSAYVWVNEKMKRIGRFHTEIEAARAYDKCAKELFGDKAKLNFPPTQ